MIRNVPFSPPDISEDEIAAVSEVLRSGWITTGPKTKQFEREIAEYCKTDKAVCLNSATAAMELTLRVLGIGEGDEVITSAYTYSASASVIEHVGAKIVLCDINMGSYEMDYDKLAELITEKTKAIIPIDIAGVMCDYNKILEVLKAKKGLFKPRNAIQEGFGRVIILSDAAHSFGATRGSTASGNAADFTSFSFHAVKNLTTAEGGAVTWCSRDFIDNDELYHKYMLLSLHGQSKDALSKTRAGAWEYDIIAPYYKCNMTDIMAAMGLAQLHRYDGMLKYRKQLIQLYNSILTGDAFEPLKHYGDNFASSGHLYLLRIKGITAARRNEIIEKMAQAGVSCNVHYKPLPMHTAYKNLGFNIKNFPVSYDTFANEITLPLNSKMSEEDVVYVANTLKSII